MERTKRFQFIDDIKIKGRYGLKNRYAEDWKEMERLTMKTKKEQQ